MGDVGLLTRGNSREEKDFRPYLSTESANLFMVCTDMKRTSLMTVALNFFNDHDLNIGLLDTILRGDADGSLTLEEVKEGGSE